MCNIYTPDQFQNNDLQQYLNYVKIYNTGKSTNTFIWICYLFIKFPLNNQLKDLCKVEDFFVCNFRTKITLE